MEKTTLPPPPFAPEQAPDAFPSARRRPALWLGLALILLVAVGAVLWTAWSVRSREAAFEATLEKRLELLASGRAEVVSVWLEGLVRQGDRIIESDLFRLYAAEVDLIEGDVARLVAGARREAVEDDPLAAQLPMMQNLLREFTRYAGFLSGRILHRSGQAYIATDAGTETLSPVQRALAAEALAEGGARFSPLRLTPSGLVLDLFLPVFAPEASDRNGAPVAVLFLSKVVSDKIGELLAGSPLAVEGERLRLVQRSGGALQEVVPWRPSQLESLGRLRLPDGAAGLAFAVRSELRGERPVYSLAVAVPELAWWVVQEADYRLARRELRGFQRSFSSIAALVVLVFGLSFGALWFRLAGAENRRSAEHFRLLARQIEEQRQLLESIDNTIADYIGLKDLLGAYRYVNPAFARAVGREVHEMIGLDDAAIFGFDTAKRLEHSDQEVLASGEAVTFSEQLFLQSSRRDLLVSKVPFRDRDGRNSGVVAVFRDVTELVAVQRRQEQAVRQTVAALVKAIELTDPYLAGHSRRMEELSREVAKVLGAAQEDVATVETAANLSQIGKLYLDRALLDKAGALSAEEKGEMERHVEHARAVLEGVDFGLPVFDAVCQMNEHLDGSGYPQGLQGEAIGLPARVLAVTNSFCAMVEPRAYRDARSPEEALAILAQEARQYDAAVLESLREVVHSPVGEKILAKGAE